MVAHKVSLSLISDTQAHKLILENGFVIYSLYYLNYLNRSHVIFLPYGNYLMTIDGNFGIIIHTNTHRCRLFHYTVLFSLVLFLILLNALY